MVKNMTKQYLDLDSDSPEGWPGEGWDGREFSRCNQQELLRVMNTIKPKAILEIGVSRLSTNRYENTSTSVFLYSKTPDCIYIGVDVEDKSFLTGENVYTLQTDSANIEEVIDFSKSKGVTGFDVIFLDGWHSINQVMKEWEYRHHLNLGGVIGLHDTNRHPGPKYLLEQIDGNWRVEKCCLLDWGITFLYANNQP